MHRSVIAPRSSICCAKSVLINRTRTIAQSPKLNMEVFIAAWAIELRHWPITTTSDAEMLFLWRRWPTCVAAEAPMD